MSTAVDAMSTNPKAPTSSLDEFLAAFNEDDNEWWRIACGHHLNLFEAAVERMLSAESHLAAARSALAAVREVRTAEATQ